jgi:HEAT repeat protein
LQGVAAQYVRTLQGQGLTEAFAARLAQADPGVQVSLLAALAGRGDRVAKPAVLAALGHAERRVREAAAAALESLGGPADIGPLALAAAKARGPERDVLCSFLSRLPGDDVGPALLKALGHADAGVRAAVIRALTIRREPGAGPAVLKSAGDKDQGVRREALAALPDLVDVSAFPRLLGLLVTARSDADREALRDALAGIGARATTPDKGTDALSGALVVAMASPIRTTLLRALGKLGGGNALWAVEDGLFDPDAAVVDAAVRALCDWPDQAPLDRLLGLAAEAPIETHRVLALRAAVRLLGLPGPLSLDEALARYEKALELATRPDERKAVLGGLAGVADPRAGAMILPDVQNQAVRTEAAVALLTVARRILGIDLEQAGQFAARAREVPDEGVRREAEAVLKLTEEMKQYLMSWQYHGPHFGPKREELFAARFPPEEGKDKPEEWKPMPVGTNPDRPWLLDLKRTPGGDDRAAYLRTYVFSAAEQKARLDLGSDDGVKAWVNGRVVHSNPAWRGVAPGQDQVPITLFPGWNRVLLKVVNGGGDWGACARLVTRDGKAVDGTRSKAALTAEEARQLVAGAPAELVLHWPLESIEGTTTADASTGAGPGETVGGPAVQPGIVGNCFAFDGTDDEVWLKAAKGLPTAAAEAWSINVFVWIDRPIPELTILAGFGDVVTGSPKGCQRYLSQIRQGIHFWGSSVDVNAGQPYDVGRWQMVTITYDGREIALYRDGKRLFANPETLVDAAGVVALAPLDHWNKINRFAGRLDEFALWRGALTQEQIAALAAPLKPGR